MYFILYSRSYCHLCEDMRLALEHALTGLSYTRDILDVDADGALLQRYDELVPVLIGVHAQECEQICHYFLDEEKLSGFLSRCSGNVLEARENPVE